MYSGHLIENFFGGILKIKDDHDHDDAVHVKINIITLLLASF